VARFVERYGWRAYALPILTAITIAALVHDDPTRTRQADSETGPRRASTVAAADTRTPAATPGASVRVEGAEDSRFAAGSTPAPVVINVNSDAVTSCASNTYTQLILVSISRQRLWACDGSKQVNGSPVTTGSVVNNDQTPLGSWRVQAKQRDRYLVGPGYRDYVKYWVPFNGDFGLHDAPWQTIPFGSGQWTTLGSHGCVHTPTDVMAWIYRWAKVGSTVVTVER
jgi:lipoprotein-anchoring transpeptidase ErfK/SrfK